MRVRNTLKATGVVGGGSAVLSYLAALAAAKWSIPLEVAATVIGTVFAFVGRWAARLDPSK